MNKMDENSIESIEDEKRFRKIAIICKELRVIISIYTLLFLILVLIPIIALWFM